MKRDDALRGSTAGRSRPQPIDNPYQHLAVFDSQPRSRKSLRLRPSELLDNAEPPSPLKGTSVKSVPPPAADKMSLFHLFSRPKVERARGHAEKGFDAPALPGKTVNGGLKSSASSPNLIFRVQSDAATAPTTPSVPPTPASIPKSATKLKFQEPIKPPTRGRKPGAFEPPPLFQAYPQSVKEGFLDLSLVSAETLQQRAKSRRARTAHGDLKNDAGAEDSASMDTKRSAMGHFKQGMHGAPGEPPRKMFVLVTSGYLLQYAEDGPSDRLPEKMLHLGKDSAAFASDLIPGQHFVLQVSQTVDSNGDTVHNSSSLFSRFGIRSAAAKRMTSSFLLVMQSGREMESWMMAIRKEIEALGGARMQSDAAPWSQKPQSGSVDLKKTPSQSHRYNVQRSPNMAAQEPSGGETALPSLSASTKTEAQRSSTATIDGIEIEASKLSKDQSPPRTRTRSPSDAPSVSSSAALSVDQQQLDNLRSSGSNKRYSRASQAPTVATTVSGSRTNSLTGSPLSEGIVSTGSDASREASTKPTYRMLSSYSTKRRSALPATTAKDAQSLPSLNTSPSKFPAAAREHDESPIVGHNGLIQNPTSAPSPSKRLSVARSEPNLHSAAAPSEPPSTKVPLPPLPRDAQQNRPESIVGELPSRAANRPASRRTSLLQSAPVASAQPNPADSSAQATSTETSRPKRMSTFSVPLKINPSTPQAAPAVRSRRRSSAHDPDPAGETPVVHALTATVEPANRRASVAHSAVGGQGLHKNGSQRLSLFPAPLPSTPESESADTPSQAHRAPAQANVRTLRRPNSMQVSSDRAPFLSSMRATSNVPPNVRSISSPTVPIRGLKPSRSASNVTALANNQPLRPSIEALKDLDFGLAPPREDDDKPMPLPASSRPQSPLPPSRAGSRTSVHRVPKTRSSLPELDLGMPVVGLGPPAPPPSAPLPQPPTHSRPGSRMGSPRPSSPSSAEGSPSRPGIDAVAGLGIRVS